MWTLVCGSNNAVVSGADSPGLRTVAAAVAGISCISPSAPADERALAPNALSCRAMPYKKLIGTRLARPSFANNAEKGDGKRSYRSLRRSAAFAAMMLRSIQPMSAITYAAVARSDASSLLDSNVHSRRALVRSPSA